MRPQPATYAEFVTQSREVLGLPPEAAPSERLNPSLHGLMKEAFAASEWKAFKLTPDGPVPIPPPTPDAEASLAEQQAALFDEGGKLRRVVEIAGALMAADSFQSGHEPGSDSWYDALETWMRARGERVTDETVSLAALKIGAAMGIWIPEDLRFLEEIDAQKAAMARNESLKDA